VAWTGSGRFLTCQRVEGQAPPDLLPAQLVDWSMRSFFVRPGVIKFYSRTACEICGLAKLTVDSGKRSGAAASGQDHQRNGAPVYPERKLSIRWDPSSAACLGSAPLSWQAWIVSETTL
jgi:hypothetical protein